MSILLSLQAVGSQAADQMPDLTAVTLPTEAEINVIDLAFKGGWIMVVLLLLSLMAIYIFVQRLIIIRRAGKEDETFVLRTISMKEKWTRLSIYAGAPIHLPPV